MGYDPEKHHRRSIRLRGFDYSRNEAYFFTICTKGKSEVLGEIVNGNMILSDIGRIALETWHELPTRFPDIELDEFVVMPNHIHGIIVFVGMDIAPGTSESKSPPTMIGVGLALPENPGAASSAPTENQTETKRLSLGQVIRVFKSISAIHANRRTGRSGSLWQRNYYEHIIRNDKGLKRIRKYIEGNPGTWTVDTENSNRIACDMK